MESSVLQQDIAKLIESFPFVEEFKGEDLHSHRGHRTDWIDCCQDPVSTQQMFSFVATCGGGDTQ